MARVHLVTSVYGEEASTSALSSNTSSNAYQSLPEYPECVVALLNTQFDEWLGRSKLGPFSV